MSSDNELPIKIVVVPPSSAQVTRALADIEARVEASGRRVGQKMSSTTGQPISQVEAYYKQQEKIRKSHTKAIVEDRKRTFAREKAIEDQMTRAFSGEMKRRGVVKKQQAAQFKAVESQMTKAFLGELKRRAAAQKKADALRLTQQREAAKTAKVAQVNAQKAAFASSGPGIYQAAGIKGSGSRVAEIKAVRRAQEQLFADLKSGKVNLLQYNTILGDTRKKLNLLERGNVRARGALHKFTAQLASTTFELTGAFYGLTVLGAALSSPAILGVGYLRELEDTKLGITGILLAMGSINGEMLTFKQASTAADEEVKKLAVDAISLAGTLADFTKSYQAILAPGLAAGMTLSEIRKIAVAGTVAVKTIGLDSRQIVQEIRDLVAGGIQAASSTLAMSLGLTDRDIKAAKASSEGLFTFLNDQLAGFKEAGLERDQTLSGKMEQTWEIFVRGMAKASEPVFESLKDLFDDILGRIATIDKVTSKLTFKKDFIEGVTQFVKGINAVLNVLTEAVKLAWDFKKAIFALIAGKAAVSFISSLVKGYKTYAAALKGAAAARVALTAAESIGQRGFTRVQKGSGVGILAAGSVQAALDGTGGVAKKTGSTAKKILSIVGRSGGLIGLVLWGAFEAWGWWKDRIKSPLDDLKQATKKTKEDLVNDAEDTVLRIKDKILKNEASLERARNAIASRKPLSSGLNEKIVTAIQKAYAKQEIATKILGKRTAELREQLGGAEGNLKKLRKEALTVSESIKRMNGALKNAKSLLKEMNTEYGKGFAKGETESRLFNALNDVDRAAKLSKELRNKAQGDPRQLAQIDKTMAAQERTTNLIKTQLFYEEKVRSLKLSIMQASEGRAKDTLKQELQILKAIVPLLGEEASIKEDLVAISGVSGENAQVQRKSLNTRLAIVQAYMAQANALDLIAPKEEKANATLNRAGDVAKDYIMTLKGIRQEKQQEFDLAGKSSVQVDILKAQNKHAEKRKAIQKAYDSAQKNTYISQQAAENRRLEDIRKVNEELEKNISLYQTLYDESRKAGYGARQAFEEYYESAYNSAETTKSLMSTTFNQLENYLVDVFSGLKVKFKDFGAVIIKELLKIQVAKVVAGIAGGLPFFGEVATVPGGGGGFSNPAALNFGLGGAFDSQKQLAFANGGAFTNSIVSTPTQFRFAKGAGLMGEAGPEAIMPLTRTSGGKLGINASGTGGGNVNNQMSVSVNVNSDGSSNVQAEGDTNMKALGKQIGQVVQSEILKQQRQGGLLSRR